MSLYLMLAVFLDLDTALIVSWQEECDPPERWKCLLLWYLTGQIPSFHSRTDLKPAELEGSIDVLGVHRQTEQ